MESLKSFIQQPPANSRLNDLPSDIKNLLLAYVKIPAVGIFTSYKECANEKVCFCKAINRFAYYEKALYTHEILDEKYTDPLMYRLGKLLGHAFTEHNGIFHFPNRIYLNSRKDTGVGHKFEYYTNDLQVYYMGKKYTIKALVKAEVIYIKENNYGLNVGTRCDIIYSCCNGKIDIL